jgi:2-dehydropantoate 2-reductase
LNQRFGRHRVLGGTAKIQSTLTSNGAIRQFNDWRTLTFGEQSGEMTERVKTLAALFASAKGVEAFAVTDIVQRTWEKLVHLSTAAAMTCLMRANVGEIVRTPNRRELSRPASVWRRHRSRQRSRAQRELYEVVGGDVLPTGLAIRDVDAA